MPKIPRFRWLILSLVFLAAVLNYIDRQTLSALAPTIQRDLGMDDRDYANVLNIFLAAYTAAYLIAGRLVDALGARFGMGVFVVWWSLANMLTAWAQGMRTLSAFRFLLGLGEAGVWPAASKVVASWFPASERALAIGLYTTGATVGAILAPYLVIPLAGFSFPERVTSMVELLGWEHGVGWRIAFVLTGLAGVLWLGLWLKFYREPRDSAYIAEAELKLLSHGAGGQVADEAAWGWRKILKSRLVWLLLLGRLLTDPVWYFFQFWLPKYLHSERDLTQEQLKITWIVYAAAGLGSLVGGWSSGILVAKKISPPRGRMWVMLGCALLVPFSLCIAKMITVAGTMAVTFLVVFASLAWLTNISSLVVDLVPAASLGTVFSLVAAGSTLGGMLMNTVVAAMVSGAITRPMGFLDHLVGSILGPLLKIVGGTGYSQWFVVMAMLHPCAWIMLYCGGIGRRNGPVRAD